MTARLLDFAALLKPRVMLLSVFTAVVGLMIAPTRLDPILGTVQFLRSPAAQEPQAPRYLVRPGIDRIMSRTAMRPIPRGSVSRSQALTFELVLAASSVSVLGFALNATAAALLASAIIVYVVIYTVWLKRRTPQNTRYRWRGRCPSACHRVGSGNRRSWN